jgi:hypothetical protein
VFVSTQATSTIINAFALGISLLVFCHYIYRELAVVAMWGALADERHHDVVLV